MHKVILIVKGTTRQAWNAAQQRGVEIETLDVVEGWNEARMTAPGAQLASAVHWFMEDSHAAHKPGCLLFYAQD